MQEEFYYPLPSEMPRAANIDEVPHFVKISKTVESLIGQNEDLMARLKVNIRQNTLLEAQLREQEIASRQIKALNSKLSSQLEIATEKEALLRGKFESQDIEIEQTREALVRLEIAGGEINKLSSYQRRVRLWVRSFISKLNYQLKMQKQKNIELENDIIESQKKINTFKTRMNEATHALQMREREHQKDKVQLIEDFENRTYDLEKQSQLLAAENKILRAKVQPLADLQKQLSHYQELSQNFEAKYEELKARSESEMTELNQSLRKNMTQVEVLKMQNEASQKLNRELELANRTLTARSHEATSRHDAINVLWAESQIQRTQLKMKNTAIIKLNQDLSEKLKEYNRVMDTTNILTQKEKDAQLQNIQEIETLMTEIESSIINQS